jgi:hypothetical protein
MTPDAAPEAVAQRPASPPTEEVAFEVHAALEALGEETCNRRLPRRHRTGDEVAVADVVTQRHGRRR